MEEYDGITFLATNNDSNFDPAFVRRITYTVELKWPNEEIRLKLFENILPDKAYMAAEEGTAIGNMHLARAVKLELKKQGKMTYPTDYEIYAIYVEE